MNNTKQLRERLLQIVAGNVDSLEVADTIIRCSEIILKLKEFEVKIVCLKAKCDIDIDSVEL
jgi:hypothetical protein